jgi:acetolactate synthase-1/2/3 large subunit
LKALRIKTPEELVQGLKTAFSSDQAIFIDVTTEPEVETLPPVFSWLKAARSE